jgi:hypothetical protein
MLKLEEEYRYRLPDGILKIEIEEGFIDDVLDKIIDKETLEPHEESGLVIYIWQEMYANNIVECSTQDLFERINQKVGERATKLLVGMNMMEEVQDEYGEVFYKLTPEAIDAIKD